MFPLSDVLYHPHSDYMLYIWRKTNFLINSNENDQLWWFWQHIIHNYDYRQFWQKLEEEEREVFIDLLSRFCYFPVNEQSLHTQNIEKKSMWIFRHPRGGIYIPVEFIKVLMNEKGLVNKNFLFSLLFRLKFSEQRGLTTLIKSSYDVSEIITNERNSLDMALVLYILFANFHTTGFYRRASSQKPNVISINSKALDSHYYEPSLLEGPTPMWSYFYSEFEHLHPALDEWYSLMKHGKKGFYRSLSLISKPKRELVHLLSSGYILPILPRDSKDIDKIKLITPVEVRCALNQQAFRGAKLKQF